MGNAAFPSSGFSGGQFAQPGGGTIVTSQPDPTQQITGQIGFVRVGGNATNFSVQTNDKVSDYYIGGETIIPSEEVVGMAVWRETLFAFLQHNAKSAAAFFGVPTRQLVEFGTEIEI